MNNNFFSGNAKSVFFLALPLMGACSWAGQMAKDRVEGVASYYGSEHFTLVASVPPNFGFTSKAQYSPRAGQSCHVHVSALGGEVMRHQQKTDDIDAKTIEQTARFDIPLEYHIAGCVMDLTRVDTNIERSVRPYLIGYWWRWWRNICSRVCTAGGIKIRINSGYAIPRVMHLDVSTQRCKNSKRRHFENLVMQCSRRRLESPC